MIALAEHLAKATTTTSQFILILRRRVIQRVTPHPTVPRVDLHLYLNTGLRAYINKTGKYTKNHTVRYSHAQHRLVVKDVIISETCAIAIIASIQTVTDINFSVYP